MRRAYRLRSSAEIQRVRAARRSWSNRCLALYAVANDLGHSRLCVSVSRRVGLAVTRNLLRRRVREALRPLQCRIEPPSDLLFIAREASAAADWPELAAAVEDLLRRARLVRAHSTGGSAS